MHKIVEKCISMLMDFLEGVPQNKYYASVLKKLYAGKNGEVFFLMQLLFQKQVLCPFESPIKEIIKQVFLQNLRHVEMLGEAICVLGGKPNFKNENGVVLSLRNVGEEFGQKQMIFCDVEMCESLIVKYRLAIDKISNKKLKEFLAKIVLGKNEQLRLLKNLENL